MIDNDVTMSGKRSEGEEHIRQAEKALKTGFLKWNPDFDSAGDSYSKAATAFKVGGDKDKAVDALKRACDCYKEMRSLFQAARMLEQAALICRDQGKMTEVVDFAERGALLYRQDGANEAAAQILEKAAKIVETGTPDKAVGLYVKAAETVEEERQREAAEYLARASRLQVRCKKYDEAVETLKKTLTIMNSVGGGAVAGRCAAGLVMVQLMREDAVAATKAFNAYGGYCEGDVTAALRTLLAAFEEEDGDAAKEALACPAIRDLDIDYARLAKQIPLPDSGGLEAAAAALGAKRVEATAGATAKAAPEPEEEVHEEQKELENSASKSDKDDDDDDDELC